MTVDFGIVYPLWAHDDDGGPTRLERVVGDVGIEHLSIPVITGPRRWLRAFGDVPSPYLVTAGDWHYHADAKLYAASGVRPRAARWLGHRDVFKRVVDFAAARGIGLELRVDLLAAPAVRTAEGVPLERNAWNMTDESAPVCLSAPTTRELIGAAVSDLARFTPRALVVESPFQPDRGLPYLPSLGAWWALTDLMRLCFCAACRQIAHGAGIDADAAARSVVVHGGRALEEHGAGREYDVADALANDPILRAYSECRWESLRQWLSRLASDHPSIAFARQVEDFGTHSVESFSGMHTRGWHRQMALSWPDDEESTAEFVAQAQQFDVTRVEIDLWAAFGRGDDALLRLVHALVSGDVTHIDFVGLDELPDSSLDALRKALRFARRH